MADLTSSQVAARLGKDARLIRLWCQQKLFPNAYQDETARGPVWMIPESDLAGFEPPKMGRPSTKKASKKGGKK
jgi:hypothetical protein